MVGHRPSHQAYVCVCELTSSTHAGRFIVPPAKIEEMYDPDVFGQSASAVMLVE
jgi:hypothetical protein